jgi:hypothetical protein
LHGRNIYNAQGIYERNNKWVENPLAALKYTSISTAFVNKDLIPDTAKTTQKVFALGIHTTLLKIHRKGYANDLADKIAKWHTAAIKEMTDNKDLIRDLGILGSDPADADKRAALIARYADQKSHIALGDIKELINQKPVLNLDLAGAYSVYGVTDQQAKTGRIGGWATLSSYISLSKLPDNKNYFEISASARYLSDDCTTVYGSRGEFKGGCKNVVMKNSTLWADVAHPILIGTHGSTPNPVVLEDLTYQNLDILDHMEPQIDYQGCLSLNAGDSNLIRNVRFDNIRIENFRHGQLVNLRVFFNKKYCTSPGRGIENVLFRNVTYNGNNALTSIIAGYDDLRKVKNITFENLRINGKLITDKMPDKPGWYKTGDMAGFFIGEHVENVTFKGGYRLEKLT